MVDAWTAVAEIGLNGRLLASHKLDLQKEESIWYLRTAVGDGKRLFAAFANTQQRYDLLDDKWNVLINYPADALENRHSGIAIVQLADLGGDGDGKLRLYVGYWGLVGVQAASLDGKRLLFNRVLNNVRMAIGPSEQGRRNLVCTDSHGSLAVLDSQLQIRDEVFVPLRMIQWIAVDLAGDGQWRWCGLSATPQKVGESVAIGVTLKGRELWHYPLPQGPPRQPIEPIIVGKVASGVAGQWLLPGADGSIHILDADGKLVDRFNDGADLCGLATVEIDGKPARWSPRPAASVPCG